MVNGIYTAASGLLTTIREINVRSNNMANLNTAGYKADRLVTQSFAEAMLYRRNLHVIGEKMTPLGTVTRGKRAVELKTDFDQGSLELTERALDFAISGDGFFVFRKSGGEEEDIYFSRNGQFQIDPEGYLINGLGDYVLDSDAYEMFVGRYDFICDEAGNLTAANDTELGRLGIYIPDNPNLLMKSGEETFQIVNEEDAPEELEFSGTILQGYAERANTEIAAEMAALIAHSRAYQTMSQIIRTIDTQLGRSINEVGRV